MDTLEGDKLLATAIAIKEPKEECPQRRLRWQKWLIAFKHIWPIYLGLHLAILAIVWLSTLFRLPQFDSSTVPLHTLWDIWSKWDTNHYVQIATNGYTDSWRTAFFPLYPLLIRGLTLLVHKPIIAGLLVANVADLIMLMVFYQLVREDFSRKQAYRAVLYLSIFPAAFFFIAAYTESLFMCFVLLSFYYMRRSNWWLAGIFGLFASLTRSSGIFLLLPFCYEYLRQCQFNLKNIRINIISGALIPAGVALFALYCYILFADPLAFSHAQSHWSHVTTAPWQGIYVSIKKAFRDTSPLNYHFIRNVIDLGPDLFVGLLIILSLVGPWRLPRTHWSYCIFAGAVYLFLQMFPIPSADFQLQSMMRYMLEIFPAFIVLAAWGKNRTFHLSYVFVAGAMFVCLLTQFLMGRWII